MPKLNASGDVAWATRLIVSTSADAASSIRELDSALNRARPERRGEMLEQVTELFVSRAARYSDEEIGFVDAVIVRLAAEIEIEARILLSRRLAPVPNAPPGAIRMLAFDDEPAVAAPVLTLSERLDDETLIENASTKSQHHLLAISQRHALGEALTNVLITRGDRAVIITVTGNPGARLSHEAFSTLIARARGDDDLAERIGARREIPPHLFLKLLAVASERVRTKLRARHPQASADIDRVVAQVAGRMRRAAVRRPRDYSAAAQALGARHRAGLLSQADVAASADAGHVEESVVALALLAALPVPLVDEAMHSDRSEAILVIARARDLAWPTVKALLRLRAGPKGISTTELQQTLASFERMSPATAEQLLRFHLTARSSQSKPS
jgi:uncharacterized protein (DUF2336 family)